jgi:hypothetical protein
MNISWNKLEQQWRKQLLSYAKGNILEVDVETGMNFSYYPPGAFVTATASGAKTIERAKLMASEKGVKAKFIISHIEDLQLEPHSFDTIVSTFSLSAYENPQHVLDLFNHWCKPGGIILLLEYGLSRCGLVNWIQHKLEPHHYRKTGNHLTRDMLSIITGSKLKIKRVEVKYAGVVYMVWATLSPAPAAEKNSSSYRVY